MGPNVCSSAPKLFLIDIKYQRCIEQVNSAKKSLLHVGFFKGHVKTVSTGVPHFAENFQFSCPLNLRDTLNKEKFVTTLEFAVPYFSQNAQYCPLSGVP